MNLKFSVMVCAAITYGALIRPATAGEQTWSQWRGPGRDGRVAATTWPANLNEDRLEQTWQVELGPGYSGPIVAEDRIFVTETRNEEVEVVTALDRATGEKLWETSWPGAMSVPFFAAANGSWIRSTPAWDGSALYVAGIRDVLVALDGRTGEELWRVDFVEDLGTSLPSFGCVASPLVVGDSVYMQAGEGFVRIDRHTGEIIWRTLEGGGGMSGGAFSSPMPAVISGSDQILVQTREALAGVDPVSGRVLWSQSVPAFRGMNILTPVVARNSVFTSTYGGGSFLFTIDRTQDQWSVTETWSTRREGYMSTPVVIDGFAYLHLKNQRFACVDLATGEEKWVTTPYGKYWSMVANGNRILALDERGDLYLIDANPNEFTLVDSRHVSDESAWAHLAVAGDDVVVRGLNSVTMLRWSEPQD